MSEASIAVLVILWAVVLARIPSIRQPGWKRAPWTAFTALAIALTADLPAVITGTDRLARITDLAVLIKHLAVIAACTGVLDWVTALTRPVPTGRYLGVRHAAAAAAAVVLAVLFAVMPRQETTQFTTTEHGPVTAAYLLVFYAYLGAVMAFAAALFRRARQAARTVPGRPGLRPGLLMMAAGTGTAAAYAAFQAIILAARTASLVPAAADPAMIDLATALEDIAILLTLTGTMIPAAAVACQNARDLTSLRALGPLWRDLTAVTPGVAAGPVPSAHAIAPGLRDARIRLIRRIAEIRDSSLQLSDAVPGQAVTAAKDLLAMTGMTGAGLDAAAEACWLRMAVGAARTGRPPAPADRHVMPGGTSLAEESAWLQAIAAAYATPAVRSAATRLAPGGPPGPGTAAAPGAARQAAS